MTENKRFMIIGENYTNIDMPVFVVCRENDCCFEVYESKEDAQRVCDKLNNLLDENKELKNILKSIADRNGEIWLDDGQIIRLKKIFKGEWVND